jgi:hypothetical protein
MRGIKIMENKENAEKVEKAKKADVPDFAELLKMADLVGKAICLPRKAPEKITIDKALYDELMVTKAALALLGQAYRLSSTNYELDLFLKVIFDERPKVATEEKNN